MRGSPPEVAAPPPAAKDGELIPPPHLFRPPVDPGKSIKPPLEPDIVRLSCSSLSSTFQLVVDLVSSFLDHSRPSTDSQSTQEVFVDSRVKLYS